MRKIFYFIFFIVYASVPLYATIVSDSVLTIREIQITGNSTTKEYVILREMSLKTGDTLTDEAIERDRNNIYNLRLFNKVDIDYTVEQNTAIVIVAVSERWYFIPFPVLGIKYRDFSKIYYGAGVMHNNFRGRNEKVFGMAAFGYDRLFMVSYQTPKIDNNGNYFLGTSLVVQEVHNLSASSTEYMNSNMFINGTVGRRFGLYQTLSATLGYEVWQVDDLLLRRTASASGRDAFVTASMSYRYDTRDNYEYTTDGTYIFFALSKNGFGESEVNITSSTFDLRQFFGFNGGNCLGIRASGVFTWGGMIPIYRHVFFGYNDRIRGYFYNKIEGENILGANIELRLPILLPRYFTLNYIDIPEFKKLRYGLYFGVFADAGRIWSRSEALLGPPWYAGYGAGFQFLLPYGFTIRLESAVNDLGRAEAFIDFGVSF
jgi:outer membrane protein assembly factor BamA